MTPMEMTDTPHMRYARLTRDANELALEFDDVAVVVACNDYFAPYLSVTLQSILENASPSRSYDAVVLTHDMSEGTMGALVDQLTRPNFHVGFLDVDSAIGDLELPQHGHFRQETFYRLLAHALLPDVRKAVYLDSDLVVLCDLAELFDTDVSGRLLAATQDADTIGQALAYDQTVGPYLEQVVGLASPLDYFQAGVLVLNLEELRGRLGEHELVELACTRDWRWLDQDVLNHAVRGDNVELDMSWDVLVDWKRLRRTHIIAQAPADVRARYEAAREHPRIVHYAGPDDRPWLYPKTDMAEHFWNYARRTPFIGEIERRLWDSRHSLRGLGRRFQIFMLYRVGMPAFDAVFPPGTRPRLFFINWYQRLGGTLT